MTHTKFSRKTIPFLLEAGKQKDVDWLVENEEDYQCLVKGPFESLVERLKYELSSEAADYHFPSRNIAKIKKMANRVGADEPVNKDWVSVSAARPQVSRFERYPHLFFGILPNEPEWKGVFVTGGLFMPNSAQLKRVRHGISKNPKPFHELFSSQAFRKNFPDGFSQRNAGVRTPKGFRDDDPNLAWLKLKNFMVERQVRIPEFTSADFFDNVAADFKQLLKLNRLIEDILD